MKIKLLPLLGGLFLLGLCGVAHASQVQKGATFAQIQPSTFSYCVSVPTSTWTRFPDSTSGNLSRRDGLWVLNNSTNTANVLGLLTETTTTPAQTTGDLLFVKGSPQASLDAPDYMYLWLKSLHTSAETVCGREYILR